MGCLPGATRAGLLRGLGTLLHLALLSTSCTRNLNLQRMPGLAQATRLRCPCLNYLVLPPSHLVGQRSGRLAPYPLPTPYSPTPRPVQEIGAGGSNRGAPVMSCSWFFSYLWEARVWLCSHQWRAFFHRRDDRTQKMAKISQVRKWSRC